MHGRVCMGLLVWEDEICFLLTIPVRVHSSSNGYDTRCTRRYTSNGMIHVQRSFREIARALNKFWLVESWFLDTKSSGSRCIAQWNNFRPIRIQDTGCLLASWLVKNCSTVRCCHWTLYPKINFQPIRICLTHAQFCGMTVGHVSLYWTCIALHSVR